MCVENSSKKTKHLSVIFQRVRNRGVMMIKCYFWVWQAAQLFDGKEKVLAKPKAVSSLCCCSNRRERERAPGPSILMWSRNLPGTQILWLTQNEPTVNAYLQVDSMTLWFPWTDPEASTCSSESIIESTRLSLSPRFQKPSQDEALVLLLLTCWLYMTWGHCRSSCVCSMKKRAHVQLHTTCLTQYKLVLSKLKPRAFGAQKNTILGIPISV